MRKFYRRSYEKMQYSPLLVMDQKRFYLDELNRVWAALPAEWRQETEAFVRQAEKLVRMSENRETGEGYRAGKPGMIQEADSRNILLKQG